MHAFGFPSDGDTGGFFKRGHGVIHCLLIETSEGLVLIDTGWGMQDCIAPSRTVKQFMNITHCESKVEETALQQIIKLGYGRSDLKHILLTHLHMDHAGGLPDFPSATIHVYAPELEACLHPQTLMERQTYRPEHYSHNPKWHVHRFNGDHWFGLNCLDPFQIAEVIFVMIPFIGHTQGHCGVALRTDEKWLLNCGDAYGYFRQINPWQTYRHPCGALMESITTTGFKMPKRHWLSVKNLLRDYQDNIQVFCSHDVHEYMSFSKQSDI
jgi:glyoxylase-like metal-dependent hydrolase (beta-lactamase superfamily II)